MEISTIVTSIIVGVLGGHFLSPYFRDNLTRKREFIEKGEYLLVSVIMTPINL